MPTVRPAASGYACGMSVFTKIIAGEIPGRFVYADDMCVVFSTIEPVAPGHMLVVPREEVAKFTECSPELFAHLSIVAQRIARAQEEAFDVSRAVSVIAGFDVPHVHIHVIPAANEQAVRLDTAVAASAEELEAAAATLRDALMKAGFGENVPQDMHRLDR